MRSKMLGILNGGSVFAGPRPPIGKSIHARYPLEWSLERTPGFFQQAGLSRFFRRSWSRSRLCHCDRLGKLGWGGHHHAFTGHPLTRRWIELLRPRNAPQGSVKKSSKPASR